MIQGTSSWAGKSLLTTALARLIARRGIAVAPFKAQNMSNNARVVDGGEIGVAQYLQARAAGVEPDVRMNPVLVKPEADDRSQVVVLGRVRSDLSRRPWLRRSSSLWPVVRDALRSLDAEYEMLVIEGAGSPAEINLRSTDLANMRVAKLAGAQVLLVADIERGGALAHLYGTWALLDAEEQALISGFVLNKFRGDAALLAPAPAMLAERTGIPVAAVVPRIAHDLPEEDGASTPRGRPGRPRVAIVRYPAASNLDEYRALEEVADVVWASAAADLPGADLVILPGSKHVASDLQWLRERGLDHAVRRGGRVLGVCGGLQMLGRHVEDPAGVEGEAVGLGLLPIDTTLLAEKATRRTTARFGALPPPWQVLTGLEVNGYEIRHGASRGAPAVLGRDLGFARGTFLGVYLHGLFEHAGFVEALLGVAPGRALEQTLDALADAVAPHFDLDRLLAPA